MTDLIGRLKDGDAEAARQLAERYLQRVVGLARTKLVHTPLAIADEEDVAWEALADVFNGAPRGQFEELFDRDDLWALLALITTRKAFNLLRHERCEKRHQQPPPEGGRPVRPAVGSPQEPNLEAVLDRRLPPDVAAMVDDECRSLLESLGDPGLRSVAVCKLEGYTSAEIGALLGCSPRTVERKVRLIRSIWAKEGKA